jgi:hypothetical protein
MWTEAVIDTDVAVVTTTKETIAHFSELPPETFSRSASARAPAGRTICKLCGASWWTAIFGKLFGRNPKMPAEDSCRTGEQFPAEAFVFPGYAE